MTIDELNALTTLTAADEVPVWDSEESDEPTKKITAQNFASSIKTLASLLGTGDVVNNLTSTATDKPLSAAQGKALNDNKANKIQTMIVEGTTDADGDIAIGLSTESYALISCSPDRKTSGYYTSWYTIIPYGATNANLYSAKCINDKVQKLASTAVRFKVNYIQI